GRARGALVDHYERGLRSVDHGLVAGVVTRRDAFAGQPRPGEAGDGNVARRQAGGCCIGRLWRAVRSGDQKGREGQCGGPEAAAHWG
ncbi:MAG: hypothetical protein AB7L18_06635, partial [Hyphomicrobiaceae bacterium]